MNKFTYILALFLILFGIFMNGAWFVFAGEDLQECQIYVDVYEEGSCKPQIIVGYFILFFPIVWFILLILLTKKGWKEQ